MLKLIRLQGARIVMERIGHTITTIATSMLKSTQVVEPGWFQVIDKAKDKAYYEEQKKMLQRRIL